LTVSTPAQFDPAVEGAARFAGSLYQVVVVAEHEGDVDPLFRNACRL
jgi:hypothetical protein